MIKILKAGILSGIVLFIWGAVSWMYLPWHHSTLHKFGDEAVVAQAIQANAPTSGIYIMPYMNEGDKITEAQAKIPMAFAAVHIEGMPASMNEGMVISILTEVLAAFLVAWLLLQTNLSYAGRVGFVVVFAIAAGVVTYLPLWNWFKFDTNYILVGFADLIIGWFLAGLVLAKFCRR